MGEILLNSFLFLENGACFAAAVENSREAVEFRVRAIEYCVGAIE